MTTPNVLFFDIETSPMLLFAWGLGKQDIPYKNIYKERQVLCIGYAFNDDAPDVITTDYTAFSLHQRDDDSDRAMIQEFVSLAEQADLVVGHNAKRFDVGVLRSRIIKHRLTDFVPFLIDDTYLKTRGIGFASHKLDYLTGFLGLEQKKEHPFEMWLDVVRKVPGKFEEMQEYCRGDVQINRTLYRTLQPYITSSLNMAVFKRKPRSCPYCGGTHLIRRGHRLSGSGVYIKYQCMDCKRYPSEGKNELKKSSAYLR